MASKPRKGDRLLKEALEALSVGLTESGAPWMVIGGIAIIARGVRRFTTDIEAAVRGDAARPEQLLQTLAAHGIEPRIADVFGTIWSTIHRALIVAQATKGAFWRTTPQASYS